MYILQSSYHFSDTFISQILNVYTCSIQCPMFAEGVKWIISMTPYSCIQSSGNSESIPSLPCKLFKPRITSQILWFHSLWLYMPCSIQCPMFSEGIKWIISQTLYSCIQISRSPERIPSMLCTSFKPHFTSQILWVHSFWLNITCSIQCPMFVEGVTWITSQTPYSCIQISGSPGGIPSMLYISFKPYITSQIPWLYRFRLYMPCSIQCLMSAEGVTCYVQGFPAENTKQIGELEPTCYGQGYPAENINHICESGPTGYGPGFPAKNSKHMLYCLCTLMQCL